MRLSHWPFLCLLILLPLLYRKWMASSQPAQVKFSVSFPKHLVTRNPLKYLLILKMVALVFFMIALARPQSSFYTQERDTSGIDIILALDVSASMSIEDLAERSRLEVAKDTLENFVRGRQNDRIGFIMFSGEPLTMVPPTLDYGLLLRSLHQTEMGRLKDGTAIGDGLALAVSHLKSSQAKSRVVILVTDGDNNLGQIDPATAGDVAAGFGMRVYTIAIGREGRVKMPIRQKTIFGDTVTAYQWFENALNPELLQLIAKKTDGKFYRVTDENTLTSVFKEIDQLEKSHVKSKEKVKYEEKYQIFLKLGLLLLVIEQALTRGWWRFLP